MSSEDPPSRIQDNVQYGHIPKENSNNVPPTVLNHDSKYTIYGVANTGFEVEKRYEIREHFGQGAYGVVCSALDTKTNRLVAIKKIENILEHKTVTKRTLREIILLRMLHDHENIIKLLRVMKPRTRDFNHLYLVTELMETDLDCIIRSPQPLTNEHVQFFIYQILRGLKCIHSAGIIHRDLKPRNILVNANCDLKICDFGLARMTSTEKFSGPTMTDYIATRWYRAPEVILSWKQYTKSMDMWAVGCILAELLARKPIFPGKDAFHQIKLIISVLGTPDSDEVDSIQRTKSRNFVESLSKRPKIPFNQLFPHCPPAACDLLEKLLKFDPDKRYTVEQALAHPYLAVLHCEEDEPVLEYVNRSEFEFERRQVSMENLRDLIYHEVATHYPDSDDEDSKAAEHNANITHIAKILESTSLKNMEDPTTRRRKSI